MRILKASSMNPFGEFISMLENAGAGFLYFNVCIRKGEGIKIYLNYIRNISEKAQEMTTYFLHIIAL